MECGRKVASPYLPRDRSATEPATPLQRQQAPSPGGQAGGQALQEPARRRRVLASAACLPSRANVGLLRLLRGSQKAPRLDPNEPRDPTPAPTSSPAGAAGPVFHGKELARRTPLAEPSLSLGCECERVCVQVCILRVYVCMCVCILSHPQALGNVL